MSSQGPNNPTTASGTSWTSPTNVEGNSAYATYTLPASTTSTTNAIKGQGFGFSIPSNASIDGIQMSNMTALLSTAGLSATANVQLLKAGVAVGSTKSTSGWTSGSPSNFTLGGPSDLWGTTWAYSDINSSTFGMTASMPFHNSNGVSGLLETKNWQIIVYYSINGVRCSCSGVI